MVLNEGRVRPHCPPLWLEPLPLTGGQALPGRVLPGPMEGITAGAFCAVINGLGLVSAWVTPFIRVSEGILRPSRLRDRLRAFSPLPVVAQVMGTDIPRLAETASRLAAEPGVIGIDLNCACPTAIVVANGGGGGRLRHPRWIRDALLALRQACPGAGISVKVRVGLKSDDELPRICGAILEGRPDFVMMHFRTVEEGYRAAPHGLRRLARARELLPGLPLFGSGDLHTVEAAARMFAVTSVDGVTPARGLVANPWLVRDIEAACRGDEVPARRDEEKRGFLQRLIAEADRAGTWRAGFVLEIARHLFGREHPLFDPLVGAGSAAAMLAVLEQPNSDD
jgi:tRNA-dihydrouridine synthase C